MYRDHTIAVVVPAFREEKLIAQTIAGVPDFVDAIFVIDDASPDQTSDAVKAIESPRVHLTRLPSNRGVGGAILEGHRQALDAGCQISVVMAGDDQMDPNFLTSLLDPIIDEGLGYTKGNRLYSRKALAGMPKYRVIGNMVLSILTKAASGYWHVTDPQNGYTAISREALESIPLDRVSQRYEFENDMLIWLNISGVRVRDVPIPARYGAERSTVKLFSFMIRTSSLLFRGFWRRIWYRYMLMDFSPVALFLIAGIALATTGLIAGLWTVVQALSGHSPTAGTTMISVVPFLMGFVLLVNALVLDINNSPR